MSCLCGIPVCFFRQLFNGFVLVTSLCYSGVERGFKGKMSPRLVKLVLSATLTQDPSKLSQLALHHPLFLTTGYKRYKLPERLESCTLVCPCGPKCSLKKELVWFIRILMIRLKKNCLMPFYSLLSFLHISNYCHWRLSFWADLRVEDEASVFGCTSSRLKRGEVHCIYIINEKNSQTHHLVEIFWRTAIQN